jgi:hypothetical protein
MGTHARLSKFRLSPLATTPHNEGALPTDLQFP